jgi:hypothetical protein
LPEVNIPTTLILAKVNISITPIPSTHNSNSSSDSKRISPDNSSKAEMSTTFNKSRLSLLILPNNPEEKQKHVIGLVLEQFSYLSLNNIYEHGESFKLIVYHFILYAIEIIKKLYGKI